MALNEQRVSFWDPLHSNSLLISPAPPDAAAIQSLQIESTAEEEEIEVLVKGVCACFSPNKKAMEFKLCDSCKAATPTLFCRADSAFLCVGCDSEIHAANKLASRHARVWLCQVCEQAPAHVTCKADAASLCISCDRDIHSANPLASRHDRIPVTPFFNTPNSLATKSVAAVNFLDDSYFSDVDGDADVSREEAEAASWLLPNPNPKDIESPDLSSSHLAYRETYPYVDLNYGTINPKSEAQEFNSSGADGVVPVQAKGIQKPTCYGLAYAFDRHCLSQSVSSSSLEIGVRVVPDGSAIAETSNPSIKSQSNAINTTTVQVSGADREARVMRYREKRKNRKFEKTIRYASRKAYAETRPRIKGRFAKRTEVDTDADSLSGYGVVPSF